jgi:hypothetical protein
MWPVEKTFLLTLIIHEQAIYKIVVCQRGFLTSTPGRPPAFSVQLKNAWSFNFSPPYFMMLKHSNSLAFTFLLRMTADL